MNIYDFDNRGRAYVDENEFFAYIEKTAYRDDKKKVLINDNGQEVVRYCNSAGCKLAEYNRAEGYGQTF